MILGPPIVGREIEGQTAGIAWALARARLRWLGLRAGPTVAIVLVAMTIVGLSGVPLARQLAGGEPGFDSVVPPLPLQLARGALALAMGLLAGVVIGRTFPAVLATAFGVVLVVAGTSIGIDVWMAAEARPMPQAFDMAGASKVYETGLRDDQTGEVITLTEYFTSPGVDDADALPPPGSTLVAWIIPAAHYPIWMWREAVLLGGVTLAAAIAFVVRAARRSPQ